MSTTVSLPLPRRRERGAARAIALPRPELAGLLALAALLNLWALSRNGFANEYYSAAVRSMSTSWHAFLFGSFDSAGVMTVDKPPLALWIQALSVRAFGFNSWAMLVPQALMGVATVGLVYDLTRRRFGRPAGFAAGLTLALTPIAVAISRHNNPDALLVLCCTAALWFAVRGLEDGRTRWIVLSGVAVGLGFEAKMAAALLVVPAIVAAWAWVAPRGGRAAVGQLAGFAGAAIAVGGAWSLLVALTPASDRPWISGTSDNSIWSLIFGYNGLGRLLGQDGGPGGGAAGPGGQAGPFGGSTGPLRLLNESLGGQGGWFLGTALVGIVALAVLTRLRRTDARTGWLIAVGGTFLTTAVAFSQAQGIFHPYYVSQLAPFTAALVGATAGVVLANGRAARIVAPIAIAAGAVCEIVVLRNGSGGLDWLPPLLVLFGGGAALALTTPLANRLRAVVVAAAIGLLLLAPAAWAVQTLGHATSGTFPAGGPATASFGGGPGGGAAGGGRFAGGAPGGTTTANAAPGGGGMFAGDTQSLTEAIAYVKSHGGGTIAVSSQSGAAGSVISSGADVAAIGGFSGRESEVTVEWLAGAIESGQIRWLVADSSGGGMPQDGRTGASEVMAAVQQAGKETSVSGLYDMQGLADALRAAA